MITEKLSFKVVIFNLFIKEFLQKSADLSEDKYTDDEESADSSDSEEKVSRKYRKKKSKGNTNTFNISSKSSEVKPLIISFCFIKLSFAH